MCGYLDCSYFCSVLWIEVNLTLVWLACATASLPEPNAKLCYPAAGTNCARYTSVAQHGEQFSKWWALASRSGQPCASACKYGTRHS